MRFYDLIGLFHWTMDEEYWSYIPFNISTGYHFPLIGGSVADTGYYTSPFFVYLMSIVSLLANGNPLGFALFVSSMGVLTTFLIWYLGRKMFNDSVAILAAFLYGSSALASLWDRHYWNASLTPILSLIIMYSLYQIHLKRNKYFLLLTLLLILSISAHGTGLVMLLTTFISGIFIRDWFKNKYFWLGLLIFVVSFLPQLLFEFRHDYLISKALISYAHKKNIKDSLGIRSQQVLKLFTDTSSRLFYYSDGYDVAKQLTLCKEKYNSGNASQRLGLLIGVGILIFTLHAIKKKSYMNYLAALMIITNIVGLIIFKSPISSYYFLPSVIPIFFIAAYGIRWMWKFHIIGGIVFMLLIIFTVNNLSKIFYGYHSYSYEFKYETVKRGLSHVGDSPFSLNVLGDDACQIYGFRYLFSYLKREPVKSYLDAHMGWLYEKKLSSFVPDKELTYYVYGENISLSVQPAK